MFLIFGVDQKEKQLTFDQTVICAGCGQYGHISVWMTCSCFTLFFLPLFRWNRRYFARMSCCGRACELDPALGRSIERGETVSLDPSVLGFRDSGPRLRRCPRCGFTTNEDFDFCPKCGGRLG